MINKIKQHFCKHEELSKEKYEYEDVKLNETLQKVQAYENTYKVCKSCGKKIYDETTKIVFLDSDDFHNRFKKIYDDTKYDFDLD